ncbi:MAG: cyclic nucleotide-binding domain-containing protein [Candidatus Gracilibacteria bacterium]
MLDLNFILNNKHFEKIILEKTGILFDEGEKDNNLYIIASGNLSVQKYTTVEKNNTKQLAVLREGAIFGEGSLKRSEPKQVKIIALNDTVLYKIDAKEGIRKFITEFPIDGINLLSEIINISNERLLESNFLVTSNYEISKAISEINLFDNRNLFAIIDKFEKIIGAEYIIYVEKNPVVSNFITIKHDTRHKGKMLNNIIEIQNDILDINDLTKEGIKLGKINYVEGLKNKNEIIGYLVIGEKNNSFSEGQKKAITVISALITGIIKQKQAYQEEKDKELNKS